MVVITLKMQGGLAPIGLMPETLYPGLQRGAIWCLCFGGLVALCFGGLYLAGIRPLELFKVTLPKTMIAAFIYYLVGGVLAPIAEEIFFRGMVYGYLRRWGAVVATLGSTLLFVAAHSNLQSIPLPQLIGGLLFAVAYEVEKKLVVPIVIHSAGNIALFSLALIG
jgi:membrane protease YdiL (CAAX protease family)